MDTVEKELLLLSCFDECYRSEIPNGFFGLYVANPKKRWRRFKENDAFAEWLFKTHELTFTNSKTVRYGEFYIFKVESSMTYWAELKMKELEQANLGVHFKKSSYYDSWGDFAQAKDVFY